MNIPNYLLDKLNEQYSKEDVSKILTGYSEKRYTTFRINTLKTCYSEILEECKKYNIEIERVPWYDNACIVKNKKENDLIELDIYKNGYIYLQSLSSMLPVLILNPNEKEDILDMAAAPGSKTTQIAINTNNKSCITACEKNKIRQERLKYNLKKQGVTCCNIFNIDSRNLDNFFSFDKILLDAPCSGSGTINLEDNLKEDMFKPEVINKLKNTQIQLLRKALKLLKPNHDMVYSTCSILSLENEDVIKTLMKEFNISINEIKLDKNIELLPTSIKGTICVLPSKYFEGFFIASIRKNA